MALTSPQSPRRPTLPLKRPTGGGNKPLDRVLLPGAQARAREDSFVNRVIRPWANRLTDPSSSLMKNVRLDDIRFRLLRAGFPNGLRATDFLFIKWVLTAAIFVVFLAFVPIVGWIFGMDFSPVMVGIWACVGALYGFKAPDIWLSMTIRRRQNEMQLALPDLIDLVTTSVEAGLGLDAAIHRVATRFPSALSEEFLRAMQEVRLGRTRSEALRDMGRRCEVADLSAFITSVIQADLLGISIANVLRVQSERLREKRSQRAREQAQKAPIKMVFPLVLFIFPALFVVILGPALIRVITSGY